MKTREKRPSTGLAALAAKTFDPTQVSVDKTLTDMQREFVKYWAQGESIMSAGAKAGYAVSETCYRMVRQPNIMAAYQEEKRLYEASCQMSRKQVMEGFLEAIDLARMCEEPGTMVAGWKEVARMCGYYEPVRVQISTSPDAANIEKQMNSMTDNELLEFVAKRAIQAKGLITQEVTDVEAKSGKAK